MPPPAIVFCCQLKVSQGDGNASGDREKNQEDNGQDAVQHVLISSPEGGEDVIKFNTDGRERKKASDEHSSDTRTIPRNIGNLSRDVLRATRSIEVRGPILAKDPSQHRQGKTH